MRQSIGKRVKPNIFVQSPGQIMENTMPLGFIKSLTKPAQWWIQIRYLYRTYASYTLIKSKLKKLTGEKFVSKEFVNQAKDMFKTLNQSILSGNIDKEITTVYFHSILSAQFKMQPKHIKALWSAELDKPQAKDVDFKDIYVFERCLSSIPSQWKICAQVTPTTVNPATQK
ncbi:hypothetical protein SAMD00019534_076430 [Acytostelium subglobosum LB1]|uniref:hypothetical protein n=1 Tax=Acytostelium subglobosum LB1 TaxID=1410327 RepID=UPI00064522F5|nr:hypothetical protein SAMD00019534_076430 [Acytostelium subglobosum LB1]GAM24468.1 hypothetical protein SAMD00019534_076430 [Acytostelium subglobosum LB1]|eukprot:XP_012752794.1 hypothetical protein SAMD00019534_076430 [Acytostelium subglobosum LB1]